MILAWKSLAEAKAAAAVVIWYNRQLNFKPPYQNPHTQTGKGELEARGGRLLEPERLKGENGF